MVLGKWLSLAFILESLMVMYLPADMVARWPGAGSAWAIPLAVVVGVPTYMNSYAAVPLVAGLMETGMALSRTRFPWTQNCLIEVSKEDRNMTDNFEKKLLLMGLW